MYLKEWVEWGTQEANFNALIAETDHIWKYAQYMERLCVPAECAVGRRALLCAIRLTQK